MLNVHYEIGILELSAVNDQQQTLELEIILNIYWKVNSLMSKDMSRNQYIGVQTCGGHKP